MFWLVLRQVTRNSSGKFAITSRLFRPIEPVEPSMQIFFIGAYKTTCPACGGGSRTSKGSEIRGGKQPVAQRDKQADASYCGGSSGLATMMPVYEEYFFT